MLALSPRAPLTIEVVDAGGMPVTGAPLAVLVLPLPSSVAFVGDPHPVRGTFARAAQQRQVE